MLSERGGVYYHCPRSSCSPLPSSYAIQGAVEIDGAQRFTSTGKPFIIKKGVLWTVTDLEGERLGQVSSLLSSSPLTVADGADCVPV